MAVIVKLGQNDPNKRPQTNSKGEANRGASPASDSRLLSSGGDPWFRDRRIIGGIGGAIALMAVLWGLVNLQAPKPVHFPVTRATADEVDPVQTPQPIQAPAYDPN